MPASVLIVEDDPRLREAFAAAIAGADDLRVAGVADDLPEGLALLASLSPDVLLVDLGLPSGHGIELIRRARAARPPCETMVVTVFAEEETVIRCIEAGATGYLLKEASAVDIVAQVRLLVSGGSPISPAIARRLLRRLGAPREAPPVPGGEGITLSPQEQSVLAYSAKGYSYEEIARLMGLSRHTIETYVKRIYGKLHVHSKTEAVFEARQMGLVRD